MQVKAIQVFSQWYHYNQQRLYRQQMKSGWQHSDPTDILVILERQLGDNLLATPLVRSLKRAWPDAGIDFLTFEGKGGILEGNPDIRKIISFPERPPFFQHVRLLAGIRRRYDLAVACQAGDRPHAHALVAGRYRAGLTPHDRPQDQWKRRLVEFPVETACDRHTQVQLLDIAAELGIERHFEVVPPSTSDYSSIAESMGNDWQSMEYVVLHPLPMWRYKRWPEASWQRLLKWLLAHTALSVVITGAGGTEELEIIRRIVGDGGENDPRVYVLAGKLSLAEVAEVIRRARAYVGPDTAVTHMAASTGVPVVALFGPTNPVLWGPWPIKTSSNDSPWKPSGIKQLSNIWLMQGNQDCVPCHLEGCHRHRASHSDCLDSIGPERVIAVLKRVVA